MSKLEIILLKIIPLGLSCNLKACTIFPQGKVELVKRKPVSTSCSTLRPSPTPVRERRLKGKGSLTMGGGSHWSFIFYTDLTRLGLNSDMHGVFING